MRQGFRYCWVVASFFLLASFAVAQLPQPATLGSESVSKSSYPAKWDVRVPAGTALAQIRDSYEKTRTLRLATADLQDRSPLPFWFRLYLRDQLQELPAEGKYQYPRVADQILEWMLAHPDLKASAPTRYQSGPTRARAVLSGVNVNLTNLDQRNSESTIAVDYSNPLIVVAASNNISSSGHQKQFFSKDGGKSWRATELPLAAGSAFQSDPSVAFSTDGTVWSSTIGINTTGSSLQIQVFKSTDHGTTWSFVSTVSTGNNNDKEMMAIDNNLSSPFKDRLYVIWDVPGKGMRFAMSPDKGATWTPPKVLSQDSAIGGHLAIGSKGDLYVAWPDTTTRELRIIASTDGGDTFLPTHVIATTNASFEISIPPMCRRNALVYLSLGVDKSQSPRHGAIYASWTDLDGAPEPGCDTSPGKAAVFVSRSDDGGVTWSNRVRVGPNSSGVDNFNQWLDVDPDSGSVYVAYYDTRGDSARHSTDLYLAKTTDGGSTWSENKITSLTTDETLADADQGNQYGDYNGLVAYKNVVHITWTDRRNGVPGKKEQVFSNAPSP
jgi:hypothetical protein